MRISLRGSNERECMTIRVFFAAIVFFSLLRTVFAQTNGDEFIGFWTPVQGDGSVVQLKRCPLYKNSPSIALCGVVVWDPEVKNPKRDSPLDCNRKIFEASKYEDASWKEGWAFDIRKRKFYNARLRMKEGNLHVRAYVGSEVNGETEIFTRVEEVPGGCENHIPEPTSLKGVQR